MPGFFTSKQTESLTRADGRVRSCQQCGLYKAVKTPNMPPYGNFKKRILNLGEAPGHEEDLQGRPFVGKTGQLLQRTYRRLGVDLFEDCLNINSCLCRPVTKDGNNRTPTNDEIDNCRRTVIQIITDYHPHIIMLLGNAAVYSLIGHRWRRNLHGVTKWRGWTIPDRDFNAWVCPTFHPSYVERSGDDGVERVIWEQDLRQAFSLVNEPLPVYREPVVEITDDLSVLYNIKGACAVDYEATGRKLHAPGHRIVCAAVADTDDHCWVFLVPAERAAQQPLIDFLANENIPKIAQNIKYEEMCSVVQLNQPVRGWSWDTMIASHVLDNRFGATGLKFQAYVQFGIVDYDTSISSYLETNKVSANSINRIQELIKTQKGKEELLYYCGCDAIFTFRLAVQQKLIIQNQ